MTLNKDIWSLDSSLQAAWSMEKIGTVFSDYSGRGRDLTITGNVQPSSFSKYDMSAFFPNKEQSGGDSLGVATFDPGGDFTFSTWFYPVSLPVTNLGVDYQSIYSCETYSAGFINGFGFRFTFGSSNLSIIIGGLTATTPTVSNLPNNSWTHFAFTWNNTTLAYTVYINGNAQQSGTGAAARVASTIPTTFVGRGNTNGNAEFNGYIDETLVFSRVLTPAEITYIYNNNITGNLRFATGK